MKTFMKEMQSVRRIFIKSIVTIVCAVTVYIGYMHMVNTRLSRRKIAVLLARDVASHSVFYTQFMREKEQVSSPLIYEVTPYFFEARKLSTVSSVVDAVIAEDPAVIVSVGDAATRMVVKKSEKIPVVGVAPGSSWYQGSNVTGIALHEQCVAIMPALVRALKPAARVVLIPYAAGCDYSGSINRVVSAMKQYCMSHQLNAIVVPFDGDDGLSSVRSALDEVDVVITLEHDVLEAYNAQIAQMCSETQTTFFAGNLAGIDAGAAVSVGEQQKLLGEIAFDYVYQIIEKGMAPSQLPLALGSDEYRFVINNAVLALQGMQPVHEPSVRQRLMRYPETARYFSCMEICN